ncbi:precorrin-6Y C5,15-methyltransferase (decarboxylating) [Meinhardsimonia xiamenensis]|jgi:precorrin-6Y C5,15-methyltransferase (decarboxylating)|uniref:Precorrin-6Y C5,15-methyltransferase (Decarboxylating) n=1 Tax=Meinhardsimonia xiamenensis TaxID=990712 RepID=A0A1G8XSI1_9RHOB|nr:precorrin-6y C5,15-methyltransferase (decarboxylating) subunit CbiE [Meinhardsimonia xiamenensis]PRX37006.1 precorrin-6Y C5,15-methyltransferase (decarboxylating) [Meinhardsimonia xiamenensis]SDJ92845.1 precorrin-6Y C5,15-methyltransferase (decarboxylating) [Meinhardsimonia xiamenensis]
MTAPWLHIVGIGEDGMEGLRPATRAVVEAAEVIIGGDRHHRLSDAVKAERIAWPSPFDALIDTLKSLKGRRVVVLATGDPLWYSVGARIGRAIPVEEIVYHPQLSAFQLAAARLGWSLPDVETLTVHGRPVQQMIPFVMPGRRLLILTTGSDTPGEIARILTERGYGRSPMTVFAAMGGLREQRFDGIAEEWRKEVPDFNTLAVECVAGPGAEVLARVPGLPDEVFAHDGRMTKREVRAVTLAALMPMPGALLWDIGAGSGSVSVEWMRAAREAQAIALEPRPDRRALAAANAAALGAPKLNIVPGRAPEALAGLPAPDAVFIGGGLSEAVVEAAWAALKPFGRLVANAVTLQSEAELMRLQAARGGELVRLAVARAEPVGRMTGWRPMMPVTQWRLVKA